VYCIQGEKKPCWQAVRVHPVVLSWQISVLRNWFGSLRGPTGSCLEPARAATKHSASICKLRKRIHCDSKYHR